MGESISLLQQKHIKELQFLVQKTGRSVSSTALKQLLKEIQIKCLWYPQTGSLKLKDWEIIGKTLHTEPRASVEVLQSWFLCRFAIEAIAPVSSLASLTCNAEAPLAYSQGVQLVLPKPPSALALYPTLPSAPTLPLAPKALEPSVPESLSSMPQKPLPLEAYPLPISQSLSLTNLPDQQQHFSLPTPPLSTSRNILMDHLKNQTSSLEEIKESSEILSMCPVNFTDNQKTTSTTIIEIKPTSYPIVTDLHKGIQNMGLLSTYAPEMIETLMKHHILVPEPLQTLSSLRTKASKPYLEFINRLQEALKRQNDTAEDQTEIIHQLARKHTMQNYCRLLTGLGKDPSLSDLGNSHTTRQ